MSAALVTGGGGFLGRAIVDMLLERGDSVRVFSRRTFPDLEARGVECLAGDLGDAEAVAAACDKRNVVYHVAALAGAWGPTEVYERTNVLGTQHVIDACHQAGVDRLVFTSSPSVVATPDGSDHAGVDESTPYPTEYLADYPRTKALAEQAVLAANGPALRTCALRPHLIIGPGDPHLVPRLIQRARAKKLRIVGDGTNKVDLTWVTNAARAHLLAADALTPGGAAAGKAYFLSDDAPVDLWPWINELLEGLGIPPVTRSISFRGAYRLGATLETVWRWLRFSGEPPMTRFVASQLATSHWFDISAAKRDFGYDPQAWFPSKQVLPRLFAHYLEGEGKALLQG